jgi:DNA-binding CsgD family transcriptional regulator
MENRIKELQTEIAGLKEKLIFAEEILDKAPCLIYLNEVGKIGNENSMRNIYLNKYAIDKTGYGREEADSLGSEYFRKILHPDDYEVIDESVSYLLTVGDDIVYGAPYKCKPKGKDYIWLIGRCRVIKRNQDGTPLLFLNAAVEVNEKFQGHNQIIELLKENKRLLNENTVLKLTKREREVLKFLANGDCAKKISQNLNVSESTIISHRKNMLRKLNIHNTVTLVNFAVENGLN